MQSNPIQQRILLMCEKWEDAKKNTEARIFNIRCQPDEDDMVDTFYSYMIGVDSPVTDIAFHFDSSCSDIKQFSSFLLDELEEIMNIWNNSEKDERIDFVPVPWTPDRSLQKDRNPAAMFVQNFNMLAKAMHLPQDVYAVAIFKTPGNKSNFITWLNKAVEAGIDASVKFLMYDRVDMPAMDDFMESPGGFTLEMIDLDLNMPKAMEQIAAMGDPKDPATPYRQSFMKMMNAMVAGDENKAEKHAGECLQIASEHVSKDPFWVIQIIVVYTALANDKIRYKKEGATLEYANKALEAARESESFFENNITAGLVAQTIMFRGTVLFMQKRKMEAYADFTLAFDTYTRLGNLIMAVEAARMAGESALDFSDMEAVKILAAGARTGTRLSVEMAASSSYAGVLDRLLETNHSSFISMDEIEQLAKQKYGEDWLAVVKHWKEPPDAATLEAMEKEEMEA